MIKTLSVIITLILGCVCYANSGRLAGTGKWQDSLMFAALGCILVNLVSVRSEHR